MTPLIFIPNQHTLVWLATPPEPPARLLARIRAGQWPLPPAISENFEIPPGLTLQAHGAAGLIVVRPSQALKEKMPGAPVRLTAGQVRVLELLGRGKTSRQIARALGRSPRWVRYQITAIRRACGRARRARRAKRRENPTSPDQPR